MLPDGKIAVRSEMGAVALCWDYAAEESNQCTGCLQLGPCTGAPSFNHTAAGGIVNLRTQECVDMSRSGATTGPGMLGSWNCGEPAGSQVR